MGKGEKCSKKGGEMGIGENYDDNSVAKWKVKRE